MDRKKDSTSNQTSPFSTESTKTSTTTDSGILNTDEDSISGTPLRSDLTTGMDTDVSAGATAGPNFMGNTDADTDAGLSLSTTTTTTTDTYAIPASINDEPKPMDAAKGAMSDVKDAVASATDAAKNQVGELAEQAKSKVGELTSQAADKVKEQLGGQKDKAAEGLTAITDVIRQSATTLEEKGQAPIADAVSGFAGQIDNFAGYLQGKDIDELAEDVTRYAKQNPQLFVGGAFLLGIALARFLKSSSRPTVNAGYSGNNSNYNGTSGYYNTSTVTSHSNSFGSTPVVPAYTGTTTYAPATTTTTYNTGSTLGSGSAMDTGSTTTGTGSTYGTGSALGSGSTLGTGSTDYNSTKPTDSAVI